jgi:hypothetical protein
LLQVDDAARVYVTLLRSHIRLGADDSGGGGRDVAALDSLGDAKVTDLYPPVWTGRLDEDVLWLEVSVREAVPVHEAQSLQQLLGNGGRLCLRERFVEKPAKVTCLEIFHDDAEVPLGLVPAERSNEAMPILWWPRMLVVHL